MSFRNSGDTESVSGDAPKATRKPFECKLGAVITTKQRQVHFLACTGTDAFNVDEKVRL